MNINSTAMSLFRLAQSLNVIKLGSYKDRVAMVIPYKALIDYVFVYGLTISLFQLVA